MAIINSLAIGKSKKSAGNLTYSTVKGRTIAKQKPVSVANPNTPAQQAQRSAMATIVLFWQLWASAFVLLFTKRNKLFSQFNQFVHLNKEIMHTPNLITPAGKIGNIDGLYISSGKYGENTFEVVDPVAGKFNITNMELVRNVALGDKFITILVSENEDNLTQSMVVVDEGMLENIQTDYQFSTGVSVANKKYAIVYQSADDKVTSTSVFRTGE